MKTEITKPNMSLDILSELEFTQLGMEDKLNFIDKLTKSLGNDINIFDQFLFGRKKEAEEIQSMKSNLIKKKGEVLSVIANSLIIILKQNESLLSTRHCAHIIGTSEILLRELKQVNERCINALVNDYVDAISFIDSKRDLGEKLCESLKKGAVDRLLKRQRETFSSYQKLELEYRSLVSDVVCSIKKIINNKF